MIEIGTVEKYWHISFAFSVKRLISECDQLLTTILTVVPLQFAGSMPPHLFTELVFLIST